ncbi:MAG: virulence RhuM family protein [Deltaproteobacteria bacterium]|nr:virulence RhuM family protein [Deltaproteobacteria bacterium]
MSKNLVTIDSHNSGKGQFLVYESEDGRIKIDVRLEDETVWLTQKLMADLFQVTVPTINEHIKNIFNERELIQDATIRKFRIVQKEGRRNITRMLDHYKPVEQYLIFSEGQAMRRIPMYMADWIKKLDAFLTVNEREILTRAGRVSHEMAKEIAEAEYEKLNQKRIQEKDCLDSDFDKTVRQLTDGKRGDKK